MREITAAAAAIFFLIPLAQASELIVSSPAQKTAAVGVHTLHAFTRQDKPKYPAHFTHFDYVNPDAPKGGSIRFGNMGTSYSTFNPSLVKGTSAPGSEMMFESLMVYAEDDPYTLYPRLAKSLELADDGSYVIFNLNENARWNDSGDDGCEPKTPQPSDTNSPVTADDIAFSYESLKRHGVQSLTSAFKGVEGCEVLSDKRVLFRMKPGEAKSALVVLSSMKIFSKKYHSQKGKEFERLTDAPPIGSGPYRVEKADKGHVVYRRVCNYWGQEIPSQKGSNNFDRIDYKMFADSTTLRMAFQKGEIDFRFEDQANQWPDLKNLERGNHPYKDPATLRAINEGQITLHEVDHLGPEGFRAIGFNSENPALKDRDVRRALALLYEPEFISEKLKAGQVVPVTTYFPGVDLRDASPVDVQNLLSEMKAKYPKQFPQEALSASDGKQDSPKGYYELRRERTRQAIELMQKAGWRYEEDPGNKGQKAWMKNGRKFPELEWPSTNPNEDLIFAERLRAFGIPVDLKDTEGLRMRNIKDRGQFGLARGYVFHGDFPGLDLKQRWSSEAAEDPVTSLNFTRTRNPVIDELVRRGVEAKTARERQAAIVALDQVMKAESPMVLTTQEKYSRYVIRNKFGRAYDLPKSGPLPLWGLGINTWWSKE